MQIKYAFIFFLAGNLCGLLIAFFMIFPLTSNKIDPTKPIVLPPPPREERDTNK